MLSNTEQEGSKLSNFSLYSNKQQLNIPQIIDLEKINEIEEISHSIVINNNEKDRIINSVNNNVKNEQKEQTQAKNENQVKIQINSQDPHLIISKASPIIQPINSEKQVPTTKQGKVKITTQQLEKLSSQEKFDLALLALSQPANMRNPIEQRLIEETIDSFAYIQKMKKRKPTIAKQVARVVEYQKCSKGQAVFYAGQQPEKFYVILRGKVAVLLKKTPSLIAQDRKNGKIINLQGILERNNPLNSSQIFENQDSFDLGKELNYPKSPLRLHSPSNYSTSKSSNQSQQSNNVDLLQIKNNNGIFGRKSSIQGLFMNNLPSVGKNQSNFFNSILFPNKGSSTPQKHIPGTPQRHIPGTPQIQISQLIREDDRNSFSGALNTPKLNNQPRASMLKINGYSVQKNASVRVEIKVENISKHINMTPDELEEPEKYYDQGVFRYEFARELTQGAAFGEMGLLLKLPRTATILAVEDTDFVCLSKQNYQQIIKSLENYRLEKQMQFFRESFHFQFKIEDLGKLCVDFSQKKKFIKDQHLFKEGEKPKEVLLIKSGEVELYKTVIGADGYICPGEILGVEEIFYSMDQTYYNAKCLHEVKAYYINKYLFIRLMHEIPDLKTIMQKRAQNKLQWQEFKIKEILEQQKLEGLIDKEISGFTFPQAQDQACLSENKEKSRRNKKAVISLTEEDEDRIDDNKIKLQYNKDFKTQPNEYQMYVGDDQQIFKQNSLMAQHARKHQKPDEIFHKNLNNVGKVQEESMRGYERIEDQMKIKEQVLEMMEKNTNSVVAQLHFSNQNNQKKRNAHEEAIHSHVGNLIGNQNWFDLEKKKQLEQKITDAIKLRRQPPGSKRLHMQLKQKVDTLPSVQTSTNSLIQTSSKSVTSLSSLPYEMQKKVIKFKKERDQYNDYISSYTDLAQDDTYIEQKSSVQSQRKKPNLSLNNHDQPRHVYYASSEKVLTSPSLSEFKTPSPQFDQKRKNIKSFGIGNTVTSSLQKLIGQPSGQKIPKDHYYSKTMNSQNSFQDIAEDPVVEGQNSQKIIESAQKKKVSFSQKFLSNQPKLVKQSTLQELEDDYEYKDNKTGHQNGSVENPSKQQEQTQMQAAGIYFIQNNFTSKPITINPKQQNAKPNKFKIGGIQYKSLNEIDSINTEESNRMNKNQEQIQSQQNNHHEMNGKLLKVLPSIRHLQTKSPENILVNIVSPKSVPSTQGTLKGNKLVQEKQKYNNIFSNQSSNRALKLPPEFVIKSHHTLQQQQQTSNQNQIKSKTLPNSTTNSRSQSFQIKFTTKI